MSLKRGLLRVWAVSAVAWFVYAFAIIDAGDAIYYAWQYHFEKETLIEAELKKQATRQQFIPSNDIFDRMLYEQSAQDFRYISAEQIHKFDSLVRHIKKDISDYEQGLRVALVARNIDSIGRMPPSTRIEIRAALYTAIMRDDAARKKATIFARKTGLDDRLFPAEITAVPQETSEQDARRFAELAIPKPDWRRIAAMFLIPSLGVLAAWFSGYALFLVGRWVWRGFT